MLIGTYIVAEMLRRYGASFVVAGLGQLNRLVRINHTLFCVRLTAQHPPLVTFTVKSDTKPRPQTIVPLFL